MQFVIICAKCQRLVDEVTTCYDPIQQRTIFTVRCHGEVDSCEVSNAFIEDIPSSMRVVGCAFVEHEHEHERKVLWARKVES